MTSETDNKVEAAVERLEMLLDQGGISDVREWPQSALRTLLSDRNRLAAEAERLNKVASNGMTTLGLLCGWDAANKRAEAAEAKLSALVEALTGGSIQEQSVGNPDPSRRQASVIVTWYGEGSLGRKNALSDILRGVASLEPNSDHTAEPGGLTPGDAGRTAGAAAGDKSALASLDRTAPESAEPAQEVAGLVEVVVNDSDETVCIRLGDFVVREIGWGPNDRAETIAAETRWAERFEAALSSSPSQGGETVDRSGAAAADDNHKALVEAKAQAIYEQWSDQEGFVPWVPGGNSHRQDDARQAARQALAAFTTKGMDHG